MPIAVARDDMQLVQALRKQSQDKYPPSDQWLILLNALAEEAEWDGVRVNMRSSFDEREKDKSGEVRS